MTPDFDGFEVDFIIPYQELLGNYDVERNVVILVAIIPYQELLGNYDAASHAHH